MLADCFDIAAKQQCQLLSVKPHRVLVYLHIEVHGVVRALVLPVENRVGKGGHHQYSHHTGAQDAGDGGRIRSDVRTCGRQQCAGSVVEARDVQDVESDRHHRLQCHGRIDGTSYQIGQDRHRQHQHVLYDELASEEIQHTHRTGLSADFHEIGVEQVHGRQHQYE